MRNIRPRPHLTVTLHRGISTWTLVPCRQAKCITFLWKLNARGDISQKHCLWQRTPETEETICLYRHLLKGMTLQACTLIFCKHQGRHHFWRAKPGMKHKWILDLNLTGSMKDMLPVLLLCVSKQMLANIRDKRTR